MYLLFCTVTQNTHNNMSTNNMLRRRRGDSAMAFIEYLCRASIVRSPERRVEKCQPEFVRHCQELYYQQNGLCAISGVLMTYGICVKNPYQISIDRIDSSRGYEIGNVRLVTWFINNAINCLNDDILHYFCSEIVRKNGFRTGAPPLAPIQ